MSRSSFAVSVLALMLTATPAAAADAPRGPDLLVLPPAPVLVDSGGTSAVHVRVVNNGDATTTQPFALSAHVPPGVFFANPTSPTSCTILPFGHTVTCTFPAGLRPGEADTADLPLFVSSGMSPGVLTGTAEATLPGDPTPQDDSAQFQIVIR
ncbi:hypothetical protein P3T37_007098 [Kitasatospora sp. MAA4]|uniref:hypothetical protein n=1 Tax=Kitasatospora sp. MAA4 TaxID=3035093 RepID=UPI0024735247|nr:hypothetical protein [Kitasatospora sp. MAA4]MDH6137665.1 hypothetical protein [Kitasatospora sp. MAA4]